MCVWERESTFMYQSWVSQNDTMKVKHFAGPRLEMRISAATPPSGRRRGGKRNWRGCVRTRGWSDNLGSSHWRECRRTRWRCRSVCGLGCCNNHQVGVGDPPNCIVCLRIPQNTKDWQTPVRLLADDWVQYLHGRVLYYLDDNKVMLTCDDNCELAMIIVSFRVELLANYDRNDLCSHVTLPHHEEVKLLKRKLVTVP